MEPAQRPQTSVGVYLALLQLFFALTWTTYVIFLPKLAEQVGIRPQAVLVILMLDQAIFAFMDWLMGRLADRWALVIGRLSRIVAVTTAVSCIAFLLLPFVAPTGSEALFLALTIVWSASSSVLRAPPLALLGKYASRHSVPWLAALSMVGLGVAGALAPILTVAFRDADPRLPFALASLGLLFVTFGLGWAERNLSNAQPSAEPALPETDVAHSEASTNDANRSPLALFLIAIALLGLGFQIHFSLNAAPLFLKFAKPPALESLMPVFWIGFSLLMLPTTFLTRRYGGLNIMAGAAVVGAQAAFIALHAGNLAVLSAAQFVAGGAWGCVMMSAVTAALGLGRGGNQGSITGALFSLLAIATFARMMIVWTEIHKTPTFAAVQPWLPVAAWMLAAGLLLVIALRRGNGGALGPA